MKRHISVDDIGTYYNSAKELCTHKGYSILAYSFIYAPMDKFT